MTVLLLVTALVIALALIFDFTNGFHDAANATSTVIATRALKPRTAVIMSAVFNFLPAFVVGTAVANTISKTVRLDALPVATDAIPYGVRVALAALVGAIFWNYLTWLLGLPSSSSHALIGGLIGAGLSAGGLAVINWEAVGKTAVAIIASPAVTFLVAVIAMWIIRRVILSFRLNEDSEFFRWGQVASSAWVSWGHGSNDAQKTMGVIVATLYSAGFVTAANASSLAPPVWVIFAAQAAIALGTMWGGWKIIQTMGLRITRITRASGFAANIGAITGIEGATQLGIPISTTQAVSASIVGSGVGARRPVSWRVMRDMVTAWVFTLPAAGLIGFVVYKLTVLPGILAVVATGAVVLALLGWAGRLMMRAMTSKDLEEELPSAEELRRLSFGLQVQNVPDDTAA